MAKKGHVEEEHENAERWLLTYADLITLLMVFFVVMYSMSRADVSKFAKLQGALQRAFRVEVLKGDVPTAIQGDNGSSTSRSVIEDPLTAPASVVLDSRIVSTIDELRLSLLQLPQPQNATSGAVQVGAARDGVVISLSGNVLFDSGRADLRPQGRAMLDVLAEKLRPMPNDVRVEGHTDSVPVTTSIYPSNWELSSARSVTVSRYLAERGGVRPDRLIAAGLGENRPAASNETREGRARNRRVDIVVLFGATPSPAAAGLPVADAAPSSAVQAATAGNASNLAAPLAAVPGDHH